MEGLEPPTSSASSTLCPCTSWLCGSLFLNCLSPKLDKLHRFTEVKDQEAKDQFEGHTTMGPEPPPYGGTPLEARK